MFKMRGRIFLSIDAYLVKTGGRMDPVLDSTTKYFSLSFCDYNKSEEEEKGSYVICCCEARVPDLASEPNTINTGSEQLFSSCHCEMQELGSNSLMMLCFHSAVAYDVQSTRFLQRACLVDLRIQLMCNVSGGWIFLSRSLVLLVRSMEEHDFWYAACLKRFMLHCDSLVAFVFDEKGERQCSWSLWTREIVIHFQEFSYVILLILLTSSFSSNLQWGRYTWETRDICDPRLSFDSTSMTNTCWNDVSWKSSNMFCSRPRFHVQRDTAIVWSPSSTQLPLVMWSMEEDIYVCGDAQSKQKLCLEAVVDATTNYFVSSISTISWCTKRMISSASSGTWS